MAHQKDKHDFDEGLPSSGFFTNFTPNSSNLLQAAFTSGTAIPMWPVQQQAGYTANMRVQYTQIVYRVVNNVLSTLLYAKDFQAIF